MSKSTPRPSARARARKIGLAAVAVAGAGAFLWLVYLGLTWDLRSDDDDPARSFASAAVERGVLREKVVATGQMEPFARVVVQSEIPGIVARVLVDDGDAVSIGQPLVELDREPLEDRVAELRAKLAGREAMARYDLVGRATANRDKAKLDLARANRLRDRGVLSDTEVEDAKHVVRLAGIAVTDARAERAARAAHVDEMKNALRRAERNLAKATIRAPIDGIVVSREVEVGTAVADIQNGGTLVAVLADDRRLHMLAEVDENDVAGVRVGQVADVRIDAFSSEVFDGRVRKVSPSGILAGGVSSFEVEIEIPSDARVRVGMSADASIVVREHRDALLIPNQAIVRSSDGPHVRRARGVEDVEGELIGIRAAASDGFHTIVGDGLTEGDLVLVRAEGP